ncbi:MULTISPECIES: ATP-binding protein [Thermomonosporaceae]|uniref:ATP-binding protein n=1 Tax=Thermomonosporaceae TaxID=2012 RepID=UPI00255A97FE|nr:MULTISPECIES: ATP-binding protein [Thermomonosporaceae]MDL4770570.1 ATP-binding protein [Actinomadura xylanilytica]
MCPHQTGLLEAPGVTMNRLLCWRRAFPGVAAQVGEARRFVGSLLAADPVCDDAVWIAGELAGNAVVHSRSGLPDGTFAVEVARSPFVVRVCVFDDGGGGVPGVPDGPEELAENGRGLLGVRELARSHGSCPLPGGGRVVWALLLR